MKPPIAGLLAGSVALVAAPGERNVATLERSFIVRARDGLVEAHAAALALGLRQAGPPRAVGRSVDAIDRCRTSAHC